MLKMLRSLCLAAAVASAAAIVGPSPGPFTPYLCQPQLADATGQAWQFDFTPIASFNGSHGDGQYTFRFAGCGISTFECPNSGQAWNYAAGVQDEGGGACEVLSSPQAVPEWSLINPANGSYGAVVTYTGARTGSNDGSKCAIDPATGTEVPRTVTLHYSCDPTVPVGQLVATSDAEQPQCQYNVYARTAAACPTRISPSTPLPPPTTPAVPVPPGYNAYPATGPFAPYLCNPVLKDSTGASYAFPLGSTYNPSYDWNVSLPNGGPSYAIAVCGFANAYCAPQGYNVFSNYGNAIEMLNAGAGQGSCWATNNSQVPCTQDCHVLAKSAPGWQLIDSGNGATGGINTTFAPAETTATDPYQCPFDPVGMQPTPRQLTVQLLCDCTVPSGSIVWSSVGETTGCAYLAVGRSAAACGVKQ